MKRALLLLLAIGLGFAAAGLLISRQQAAHYAAQWAQAHAGWLAEKAALEAALEAAREQARLASLSEPAAAAPAPFPRLSPAEIVAKLQALRMTGEGGGIPALRQAVYLLEELTGAGPAALPAIRDYLARCEDLDWDTSQVEGRGGRNRPPVDFIVPPSLRFGLFDVLRRIGGTGAAQILGESLNRTGRGVEVAYLARVLQELAPGQYRDASLEAARALLAATTPFESPSPLDRYHRDQLFGVLVFLGDTSYAAEAQGRLVQAGSQLDRGALRYLQQALGAQAVPIIAQTYLNAGLTNAAAKEPLARVALAFVGADAQANQFYQVTINDPVLTKSHRKNLIEDLNQDGFRDTRNLTADDLPLIQNRLALIEQLAPQAMDEANAAAFKEAYKDLVNMRDRILKPAERP